jgi:hypothetical protein
MGLMFLHAGRAGTSRRIYMHANGMVHHFYKWSTMDRFLKLSEILTTIDNTI